MKYIFTLTALLSLTGCLYQSVNSYDIKRAIIVCGSVENIHEMSAGALGEERVICFDGKRGLLK